MFRILKLMSLLFFFQFYFANGGNFNVKTVFGKWELTNVKDKSKNVIEIKNEKDSIILYHEDEYGNFNILLSFQNKPFKIGPKKVTYRKESIDIWGVDTLDVTQTLEFYDFNGKTGKMSFGNSSILKNITPDNVYKMNPSGKEFNMKRVK
jgi:hypothetical protein